MEKWKWGVKI